MIKKEISRGRAHEASRASDACAHPMMRDVRMSAAGTKGKKGNRGLKPGVTARWMMRIAAAGLGRSIGWRIGKQHGSHLQVLAQKQVRRCRSSSRESACKSKKRCTLYQRRGEGVCDRYIPFVRQKMREVFVGKGRIVYSIFILRMCVEEKHCCD